MLRKGHICFVISLSLCSAFACIGWNVTRNGLGGKTDYEKLLSEHVMIPAEQGALCKHVASLVLVSVHH